ncbi:unnamed protein product [Adineta steineri]|uniref:Uncharacterized protein n=1 Tax=Adineta steineri TaxID=433720 RepID=A0A815E2N2_9BILA|nr:unnamed protein product [Adineta steineri]CAF1575681.1 unnamed protein product [Adineta steineri]
MCEMDYWFKQVDYDQLTNFIKEFSSSFRCLSLDWSDIRYQKTYNFPLNPIKLKEVLEVMINLQKFHLFIYISGNTDDNDVILSKFNDLFWSDHNLSFGMDGDFFFTLPFQFDYFPNIYRA